MRKIIRKNIESASFDYFMDEACKHEVMTKAEEYECFRRMYAGDERAREELIMANQRFLLSVAKKFNGLGVPLDDLMQEGNLGLIEAIDRFDMKTGNKLISYAIWWIRQAMQRVCLRQGQVVRCPSNQYEFVKRCRKAMDEIVERTGREPDIKMLASEAGVPETAARGFMVVWQGEHRLDRETEESGRSGQTYKDLVECKRSLGAELDNKYSEMVVDRLLKDLDKRTAKVMVDYYGIGDNDPVTLDTIGKELNLSRERIRQIKTGALEKMATSRHFRYIQEMKEMGAL